MINPQPGGALRLERRTAGPKPPGPERAAPPQGQGFASGSQPRKPGGKRRRRGVSRLSAGDWGPLGKHPDLEAIVARQRLGLPLSGRLGVATVNQAWKSAAGEHHPDRGGAHDTMQAINAARDHLLGRHED